ncbi:MAG: hypothetical protein PHD57_10105 [Desulfobacterales bacterium]|nr:hypothetical protein [Desulfobacterales bacterium]
MSKKSTSPASEPPGKVIFVCGSKFSKSFVHQAAKDFQSGEISADHTVAILPDGREIGAGQIVLPDGQIISAGPTYETTMSPALIQMVKDGILQASNFGKLKGGKLCQQKAM